MLEEKIEKTLDEEFEIEKKSLAHKVGYFTVGSLSTLTGVFLGYVDYNLITHLSKTLSGFHKVGALSVITVVSASGLYCTLSGVFIIQDLIKSRYSELTGSELTIIEERKKGDKTPQPDYLAWKYTPLFVESKEHKISLGRKVLDCNKRIIYYSLVDLYLDGKIDILKESETYPNKRHILSIRRERLYIQRKAEFPDSPFNNRLEGIFLKEKKRVEIRKKAQNGLIEVPWVVKRLNCPFTSSEGKYFHYLAEYVIEKGSRGTESDAYHLKDRIERFEKEHSELSQLLQKEILRGGCQLKIGSYL